MFLHAAQIVCSESHRITGALSVMLYIYWQTLQMRLSFFVVAADSVTFVSCVFDSFVPLSFTLLEVLSAIAVLAFSIVYLDFFAFFVSKSSLVLIQEVPIYASLLKYFIKKISFNSFL